MLKKQNPGSNFIVIMHWVFSICVTVIAGAFTNISYNQFQWQPLLYVTLFCLFIAISRTYFYKSPLFKNPFLIIGIPGIFFILFTWTFVLGTTHSRSSGPSVFTDPLPYITLAFAGLLAWLLVKNKERNILSPELFSFAVLFFCIHLLEGYENAGLLILNFWIFAIACYYIAKGARLDDLSIMNFGLVVIAILAICRFFDDNIPFLFRGLFFVTAGAGFFVANLLVIKRRKQSKITA